jgi:hypothetical protein
VLSNNVGLCVCVCVCVRARACLCMYICMYLCIMYVCMYVCTYVCIYVFLLVCKYVGSMLFNLHPYLERGENIGFCDHHNACVGFISCILTFVPSGLLSRNFV